MGDLFQETEWLLLFRPLEKLPCGSRCVRLCPPDRTQASRVARAGFVMFKVFVL